jgi:uncharacterized protein
MMISMLKYLVTMFVRRRACLKSVMSDPNTLLNKVEDLHAERLKQLDIKLLALDFDGVLSYHGAERPSDSVINWLQQLDVTFSLENVCIYSNNLFSARVDFLNHYFPTMKIIYYTKKKPYPDDLLREMQRRNLAPGDILVVDDRLTSGILSACIIGAKAMVVRSPVVNYQKDTIKEYYFRIVRIFERWLV